MKAFTNLKTGTIFMEEKKNIEPVRTEADLLAYQRTVLAEERTLMAWVRTSLAMIGFGFTIYKLFTDLRKDDILPENKFNSAKNFGLALVLVGTILLIAATIQHQYILKDLNVPGVKKKISLPSIAAVMIIIIGLSMLVGILLQIGPLN
ncbi:MAG: DUF202 domain-containing protein [bacterium]